MARSSHRSQLLALGALAATLLGGMAWLASPAALPALLDTAAPAPAASVEGPQTADRNLGPARREVGAGAVSGPEGAYRAPVGTRLRFELAARIGAELVRRDSGARADQGTVRLTGRLQLTVLDRRDDEAVVEVRLPGLSATSPQARSPEAAEVLVKLARALGEPALARMDTTGRVTGYRFAPGTGYLEKTHLRALLAGLRFVVPHEAAGARQWAVLDRDDSGEFEATYARRGDDGEIRRERTRYTAPQVVARGEGELRVLAQGRSTAVLSQEIGWLVRAEFDDRTVVSFDALEADVRSSCCGSVELAEHVRVARSELPEVDWDGAWEPVGGDPAAAMALARGRERDRWAEDLESVDLGSVIAELAALCGAGVDDGEEFRAAWAKLARLFEVRPEVASEALAWLESRRIDEATSSAVLTALGCAGTPQAQEALLRIQRSESLPPALRGTATIAMVQVEEPTAATLTSMLAAARGEGVDDELGRLSLMVLGTVAPRGEGGATVDALVSLEEQCRSEGRVDAWLHALGNSGVTAVAAHAERYLGDGDERVREAAAVALRSARTASAERLLIAAATRDASTAVRSRAAESLGEHGTERARDALCALLSKERDGMVREAAVLGLGEHLDPVARAALQGVAATDPDENLRQLAAELLSRA